MSTNPSLNHNEQVQPATPQPESVAIEGGTTEAPKQATPSAPSARTAEADKLFEKLFANSSSAFPAETASANKSVQIPSPVAKKIEAGETFTRKVADDAEVYSFQRIATEQSDCHLQQPDRIVDSSQESAVPPPLRKTVETSAGKTRLKTQDKPTDVDTFVSDPVKAQLLDKVKAAKHANKPELNFPERINNLKTQHDTLRARLAKLE